MTKAADLSALGSNVTTAGNLSSASTLTLQTNSTTALTINSSQNVGIGTASPITKLNISGSSLPSGELGTLVVTGNTTAKRLTIGVDSSSTMYSWMQSVESGVGFRDLALQPLGGNVGIGTTSPSSKLTVGGNPPVAGAIAAVGANSGISLALSDNVNSSLYVRNIAGGSLIGTDAGNALRFATNGNTDATERMRIDSGGNVGIGVTPSAWGSNFKVIESAGNSSAVYAAANVNGLRLTSNLYNDNTNFIYKTTGEAAVYAINTSIHQWFTAPSGTAGTTATLTERMRLSSAGGFSVGTTSDPGAGAIYATGNITAFFSDIRLKNNEGRIDNALDKVSKLSGIYYTTNETAKEYGYTDEARQVGVIAQEVKEVLPEIVKAAPFDLDENGKSKSGQDYMTVQYDKLVPLLIEAIKELKAEVDELKKGK